MPDAAGELGNRFQCRANIQSSKLERDGLSVTRINYYTHRVIITISLLITANMRNLISKHLNVGGIAGTNSNVYVTKAILLQFENKRFAIKGERGRI